MGKLTALQIRNLKTPGRYGDRDGLTLVLKAAGKGHWVLRTTIKGRRRDIGLGSLSLVSLKEARDTAIDLRRDIRRGIDPIAHLFPVKFVEPSGPRSTLRTGCGKSLLIA